MKKKIILPLFFSLLLLSSCKAEDTSAESNDDNATTLIMACPTEVEDYYLNIYQKNSSDLIINMFNQSSENYLIEKKEYDSSDKLLVELLSGQSPDLLYVSDWLDMTPLYSKNLLCNLYEYIDSDDEISRSDFVEPVIEALEINGGLYEMPYDFIVQSAIAKADIWGNDTDNSIAHLCQKAEQLGYAIPFDLSLESACFPYLVSAEFINFNNGTCSFVDGRFEELIVLMKKYYDYTKSDSETHLNGAAELFRDNEVMVTISEFASFEQLEYFTLDVVGEKLKYVGLPSEISNYQYALPIVSFSIFENSDNKDAAFKFIKYYTSYNAYVDETHQNSNKSANSYTLLPINKSALDYYAEEALSEISQQLYTSKLDDELRKEYQKYSYRGNNVLFQ